MVVEHFGGSQPEGLGEHFWSIFGDFPSPHSLPGSDIITPHPGWWAPYEGALCPNRHHIELRLQHGQHKRIVNMTFPGGLAAPPGPPGLPRAPPGLPGPRVALRGGLSAVGFWPRCPLAWGRAASGPRGSCLSWNSVSFGLRDFIGTVGAGFRVTCLFSAALQFFSGSLSKIKTSPKLCSDKGCARGEYRAD